MIGSGYYGSSSSNLSPLAPPFNVERSNHNKPAINDTSSYAAPSFSQSTGVQGYYGDSSTITNDYGYIVTDAVVDSSISHNWDGLRSDELGQVTQGGSFWSGVNPSSKGVGDSSFYGFGEGLSVKADDNCLVRVSDGTDYTRDLSGLEYEANPNMKWKQGGVSSRLLLGDGKPIERMVNDDGFVAEEANSAASFAYNNCLNQGAYCNETLSKGKDDPSMLCYADIIRRANNNGKSDGTSSFENNQHRLGFSKFSLEEAYPSLIQSTEDAFWNGQKVTPAYEKRYHNIFEECMLKSKKSAPVVIKSPAAKSLEIGSTAGVSNVSDVVVSSSRKSLKEKEEFQLPQLSFQMGTTDTAPFSIKDTKLSSAGGQPNFEFKAKPSFIQIPDINITDTANSSDHHNPAEDSPCWKGTPFLPFGSPKTQPSTNKLQKSTNVQETDYSYNHHEKTSVSPIPFYNDAGEVVDSLKVRDGGDDAVKPNKPEPSKINVPNLEEPARFPAEMFGEAADKKLNASILVKELYNLSELLLQACSNEVLKEHDYEALTYVTHNLAACMSRQVQVATTSTNKPISPLLNVSRESQVSSETSGTLQDGGLHARHQKMQSDVFGESVKNLQEHASLRDLDSPKGDNMVQAIKKVLDENLECEVELPSETSLLYKNLWLEAEAELCCLSSRARFERLKRETQEEKSHKPTVTRDAKESLRSCNGSTFLKADNIEVSNTQRIDDIINVHGEQNPVKEGNVAGVKVIGAGVTMQHQLYKDDDGVDPQVIARLNILKQRGESTAIYLEEGAGGDERQSHFQNQEVSPAGSGSEWEHILKDEVSWRLS